MKKQITYLFLFIYCVVSAQNRLDSLTKVLQTVSNDTDKVKTLLKISLSYGSNDPGKAFEYCDRAVTVTENANYNRTNKGNKRIAASAYRSKGVASYFLGNYSQAIKLLQVSLKMSEDVGDKIGCSSAYGWLGNTYYSKGDFEKALQYLLSALKLQEELGNKVGLAGSMNGIANIYRIRKELNKALEYYFKSLEIRKKVDDKVNEAYTYNNIGLVYAEADSLDKSLFYHLKCLQIVKQYDDKKGMANSYGNIGDVYQKQKKFRDALVYLFKSLEISTEIGDKNGKCASYYEIGKAYEGSGDYKNAGSYFDKSVLIGKEIEDRDAVKDNYQALAGIYYKSNDHKKAMKYYESYALLKDSLLNRGNDEHMQEMQASFDTEQKQKEIELLQKDKSIRDLQLSKQEASIKRQRIIIYAVIGGLLLVIALIFVVLRGNKNRKKANLGLERKNSEIELQKQLIEEKTNQITDSIDYASTIQNAILPPEKKIKTYFPDSFVLFLPKDVVSGDFYWLHGVSSKKAESSVQSEKNTGLQTTSDSILFATIDCVGHGVPGAFMSIMANGMLESSVIEKSSEPSLILDELNETVKGLNSKSANKQVKYGLDLALMNYDAKKMEVKFAGTNTPLIIIGKDKAVIKLEPDNKEIGKSDKNYRSSSVKVNKGDMIYLFTNGFSRHYSGFSDLLTSVSGYDSAEQKENLRSEFLKWRENNEQEDDVLLIGIRI